MGLTAQTAGELQQYRCLVCCEAQPEKDGPYKHRCRQGSRVRCFSTSPTFHTTSLFREGYVFDQLFHLDEQRRGGNFVFVHRAMVRVERTYKTCLALLCWRYLSVLAISVYWRMRPVNAGNEGRRGAVCIMAPRGGRHQSAPTYSQNNLI